MNATRPADADLFADRQASAVATIQAKIERLQAALQQPADGAEGRWGRIVDLARVDAVLAHGLGILGELTPGEQAQYLY